MKYEAPELKALSSAINAIQATSGGKASTNRHPDSPFLNDSQSAYADWED